MGVECKVCNSEKRDYIEQLILQGNSNLTISATLKDMNEDISHASINRHKTKHMPEYTDTIKELSGEKGNRKYDREDSKNAFVIDIADIKEDIKEDVISINYDKIADSYVNNHLILIKIVSNQLGIVLDLQDKYMKGKVKYPNEQIRGLETMQNMLQKSEEFIIKHLPHYAAIVKSHIGCNEHIYNSGKNAKLNMPKYLKGDIFKIALELDFDSEKVYGRFAELYMPNNPYQFEKPEFGKSSYESKFKAFKDGCLSVTSEIETKDVQIYMMLEDKKNSEKMKLLAECDYEQDIVLNEIKPVKRKR